MIVGIGIDLVDVARVRRLLDEEHAERARERLFSPREIELAGAGAGRDRVARRALRRQGSGDEGARHGLERRRRLPRHRGRTRSAGAPTLALSGAAAERARALGVARCHVSLTHTRELAQAIVVLES
jgi:holo-[acyl-carrier protein] synthase